MSRGDSRAPAASEWMGASPHCGTGQFGPSEKGRTAWELGRCVSATYALHPEATTAVHHLEKVLVLLAPEEAQAGDLEVGPEVAHVVAFALHGLRVYLRQAIATGLGAQDLFRQGRRLRVLRGLVVLRLWLGLDEHLPQALGGQVVHAFVRGGVAPDVWHGFSKLFNSNGEAICFVGLNHGQEGITVRR